MIDQQKTNTCIHGRQLVVEECPECNETFPFVKGQTWETKMMRRELDMIDLRIEGLMQERCEAWITIRRLKNDINALEHHQIEARAKDIGIEPVAGYAQYMEAEIENAIREKLKAISLWLVTSKHYSFYRIDGEIEITDADDIVKIIQNHT